MNNKERIYLEIESKRRELYSRVYFAIKAAKKNFSVVISKKSRLYENLKSNLQKGHVILKSASKGPEKVIKFLKENNHQVYAWDEEGALLINAIDTSERVTNNSVESLTNYFCWGKKEFLYIKNRKKKIKSKNIEITGNTRIELLKKKNLYIYKTQIDKIKDQYKKYNLYLTSFHRYNSINDNISSLKNSKFEVKNSFNKNNKKKIIQIRKKVIEIQKKNFDKTLEFFRAYESSELNIPLIIRPHPAENIQVYLDVIKNFKKIKICFDHSNTNAWILASEKVISCNCTAQVEAFIMNKPSINLMFYNDKHLELKEVLMCSINVKNNKEAFNLLRLSNNKINRKINRKLIINKLNQTFFNIKSNICSVQNITNILSKNKNFLKFNKDRKTNFFYFYYFTIRNYFKSKMYNFLHNETDYLRNSQKIDGIILKEVVELIKQFTKKDFDKFIIKQLYPGVICIEKRNK
tara:strand:+ start:142 stop:1533 length:1392 start_codon:yes stop_codon:yes gene_type:complete